MTVSGTSRTVIALLYRRCTAGLLHIRKAEMPFSAFAPPPSCRWPREGMWVWPLLCNSVHLHYIIFCRTPSIQRQHGVFSFLWAFSPVNPKTGTPLDYSIYNRNLSISRLLGRFFAFYDRKKTDTWVRLLQRKIKTVWKDGWLTQYDTHAIIKVQTVKKGCSSLDNKGGDLDVNFRNAAVVSVDHHDRLWYLRIHKEITAP